MGQRIDVLSDASVCVSMTHPSSAWCVGLLGVERGFPPIMTGLFSVVEE